MCIYTWHYDILNNKKLITFAILHYFYIYVKYIPLQYMAILITYYSPLLQKIYPFRLKMPLQRGSLK